MLVIDGFKYFQMPEGSIILMIEILSEKEYVKRLEENMKIKCCQCQYNNEEDDIDSYRDKMSLDGKCLYFR